MSKFSQRHYEAIADIMQEVKPTRAETERMIQWENTVIELAEQFRKDNDKFKQNKFLVACGLSYPLEDH